jgi:hypothetical protein
MNTRTADLIEIERALPDVALCAEWQRDPVPGRGWRCWVSGEWAGQRHVVCSAALDLDGIEQEHGPGRRKTIETGCERDLRRRLRRHLAGYQNELQTDHRLPGVLLAPGRA